MRAPPVRIPAAAQHDLDLLTEHAAEFFEYMHIEPPPGGKYSQGVIVGAALAASRLFVLKMQAQPDPGNAGEIVGSEVEVERLKNDLDAANTALANERAARSAYAARQRELGRSQINIWMSAEEAAWVREALDKRRAGGAQIDLEDTIAAGPHAVVGFWLSTVEADVASVDAADAFAATEARFAQLRRADGTLPADWAFVATFGPAGTPALAALGHQVIGQDFEIDDQGGSGDRVWGGRPRRLHGRRPHHPPAPAATAPGRRGRTRPVRRRPAVRRRAGRREPGRAYLRELRRRRHSTRRRGLSAIMAERVRRRLEGEDPPPE